MLSADRFPRNQAYSRTFDGLQLLQYREIGAAFNCRRPVRQRLNRHKSIPCLATSSARLAGGGQLPPRIPAARAGLRLDATWNAWEVQVPWVRVARQNRVAGFEAATPGQGMLNLGLAYRNHWAGSTPWRVYLKPQPDRPAGICACQLHQNRRAGDRRNVPEGAGGVLRG